MTKWFKSYRFRHKFTIDADNIDAALTDFPVALLINSSAGTGDRDLTKVFDIVGARWTNLAVCGADGQTPLWTEVDLWDATNEKGVLHVKVPKISASTDTDLYLYFDADGLGNGYIGGIGSAAGMNVWDSSFAAVWHMNGDPSAANGVKNSKANSNHLSGVNMEAGDCAASAVIGKHIDFDGSNEYMVAALSGLPTVNVAKTAEMVFNVDTTARLCCGSRVNYGGIDNTSKGWVLSMDGATPTRRYYHTGVGDYAINTGPTVDVDSYVASTCGVNGASAALYLNGAAVVPTTSTLAAGNAENGSGYFVIGYETTTHYANGQISEVRLSSVARSAAWIKATYHTLFDSLGAFSAVEAISAAPEGSWLADWQYRMAFTIAAANIDAALTDFPVALVLSTAAGTGDRDLSAIFDTLGANSLKIAVTDHTGIRQLFVEVDSWNNATESAVLHTKVPHVDADTATLLYLYYDANKANNSSYVGVIGSVPGKNVWDSSFVGVHHLSETATGTQKDSTGYADATTYNLEAEDLETSAVGLKGLGFDGTNEYAANSDVAAQSLTSSFTVELLAKVPSSAAREMLWNKFDSGNTKGWGLNCRNSENGEFEAGFKKTSTDYHLYKSGTYLWGDGVEHLFSMYYPGNGNKPTFYVDGVDRTTDFSVVTSGGSGGISGLTDSGQGMYWGRGNVLAATTAYAICSIFETRMSSGIRSAAWIKATYRTLFDTLGAWSAAETYAGLGWLRGFTKRAKVMVAATNIDAALDYFPVTLFLSSSCGTGSQDLTAVFDEIGANSSKIAVTSADGKTQLPVEIDYWDSTGETAVLHVRVPSVDSAATTVLYLYYSADVPDNDEFVGAVTEAPAMSVWDADFVGVWHQGQDPSGTAPQMKDSTVNGGHGTSAGTMTTADLVDSNIGKGIDFDGTDDYIDVPDSTALDAVTTPSTLEVVIQGAADWVPSGQDYHGLLCKGYAATSPIIRVYERSASSDTRVEFAGTSSIVANDFANGVWKYITGVAHSGAADQIFVDGAEVAAYATQVTSAIVANDYSLRIGDIYPNSADYLNYDGIIAEARISKIDRSAAWIKATYYTLSDGLISYAVDIESEDNWLGDWANRIQIRIDSSKIDEELINFPVAIFLGAAAGINGADVTAIFDELGANNLKLAVATAAGAQCYVDIERWDETGEEAVLHVKVPTIYMDRDTIFYLYYDADKADNSTYVGVTGSAPAQSVWSGSYLLVLHMNSASAVLNAVDGSAATLNGTLSLVDGPVSGSKGLQANADGDNITAGAIDFGNDFTAEAQFYIDTGGENPGYDQLFGYEKVVSLVVDHTSGTNWGMYLGNGSAWDAAVLANSNLGESTWYTLGVAKDSAAISYTRNGSVDDGGGAITDRNPGSATFSFFARGDANAAYRLHGIITELRLSSVARTDNWMYATQYSLLDSLVIYGAAEALGGGWLDGWHYRRAFTVPSTNIDANLTSFPLALILNTSAGTGDADISTIFDELGANSSRVAVCTAHGDKQVPVEIDMWDSANESAVLHAKCPLITAADGAVLYVYYDDDRYDDGFIGDTGDAIAKRVWDADFAAVWHMSQDPSGGASAVKDSTSNGKHGTSSGSMTSGDLVTGAVGKAIDFDGSNDYLGFGAIASGAMTAWTVEGVCSRAATGNSKTVITNDLAGWNDDVLIGFDPENAVVDLADDKISIVHQDDTSEVRTYVTTSGTWDTGVENYFSAYGDGSVIGIRKNADAYATTAKAGTALIWGNNNTYIGYNVAASGRPWGGYGSEFRVSKVKRADAWTKATYYTLFDALAAWGAEGTDPTDVAPTLEEPLGKAGRIAFTANAITDELSITEALLKAGRIAFSPHSITTSYAGNVLKMINASGSRPKVLTATGARAKLTTATGARPRLAAAAAFEYQERE